MVLALSIANFIIQNNLADGEYLENHTLGFPEFSERASAYDTDTASEITGVLKSDIERVGRLDFRGEGGCYSYWRCSGKECQRR